MGWLKIDDGFESHPKVALLSDAAHRLWMRAACWCRSRSPSGFVPRSLLREISRNSAPVARLEKLAEELVEAKGGGLFEAGLWEPVEGGWLFHDWASYQPSKAEPMSRQEAASLAGKRSAEARRERTGTAQPIKPTRTSPERPERRSDGSSDSFDRTSPERPEPPLPLPLPLPDPEKKEARVVAVRDRFGATFETSAPDSIEFSPEHRAYAAQHRLNLEEIWLECRDKRRSVGYRCSDWAAEFAAWMRAGVRMARERGAKPGSAGSRLREPVQPNGGDWKPKEFEG